MSKVNVIGGGLAGCEAAFRIASAGFGVDLWEMRPAKTSPAHQTDYLAELVCSNSLGPSALFYFYVQTRHGFRQVLPWQLIGRFFLNW